MAKCLVLSFTWNNFTIMYCEYEWQTLQYTPWKFALKEWRGFYWHHWMCSECELFCILYYPCVLAFLEIETEISYLQDFNIFQLSHSHRIIEIGQVILANLDQTLYFRNNIERLKVLFICLLCNIQYLWAQYDFSTTVTISVDILHFIGYSVSTHLHPTGSPLPGQKYFLNK